MTEAETKQKLSEEEKKIAEAEKAKKKKKQEELQLLLNPLVGFLMRQRNEY